MTRKLILNSLLLGLLLALLTMAVPYRYCRNGPARGYPFAAWCPVCEATRFSVGAGHVGYFHVLDLPRLLGNVLLWSGLGVGVLSYRTRRMAS
jgi:hypothetical protein